MNVLCKVQHLKVRRINELINKYIVIRHVSSPIKGKTPLNLTKNSNKGFQLYDRLSFSF